ncbi:uncharacterized protein [Littorina saxatilis]|uniref:uncharacterized protein n=1 Tax=Littorina saxatilis TaxID=31220 RepID=UPI0038B6654A
MASPRGDYKVYLSDPNKKVPKVTKWRHRKRQRSEMEGQDVEASAVDNSILRESFNQGAEQSESLTSHAHTHSGSQTRCNDHDDLYSASLSHDPTQMHLEDAKYADDEDDIDFEIDTDVFHFNESDPLEHTSSASASTSIPEEVISPSTPVGDTSDADDKKPTSVDELLYDGARLTVACSMLLIIAFVMRHGLTGQAMADLLALIEMHCVVPNLCRKTLKMFTEFFKEMSNPIEFHYYCSDCYSYLGLDKKQSCHICQQANRASVNYFIIIPVIHQLQSLFDDGSFEQKIRACKEAWKQRNGQIITDVMDGKLYREAFNSDGQFNSRAANAKEDELHISFQLNTDGVSIFRSSVFSIWPLYMVINELPPDIRFSRTNRIFAGLWFGKTKPQMLTFLTPLATCLKDLFNTGFQTGKTTVKGLLLSGVFDSPARSLFQNIIQFNGFHGCPYCLMPGETFRTSAGGCTHIYPLNMQYRNGCGEPRTHQDTVKQAEEADALFQAGKHKNVKGVKGKAWSMCFPHFDVIRGVALDYMHCVCLGVTKMLMTLWFDKSHKSQPFSISNKLTEVSSRLMKIKPPNFLSRLPRPLTDMCHYKASEYKSFLLYYSLPCLMGILPGEYFQHYILLVEAMYILLGDQIIVRDIERAERLLLHFCMNLPVYYGERYLTSNVHLLLHAAEKVKDLGPLWANSCFYFEDFNGQLRSLFHGTQKIEVQVSLAVRIHQTLPTLANLLQCGTCEHKFFHNLAGRALSSPKEYFSRSCGVLGTLFKCNTDTLDKPVKQFIRSVFGTVDSVWMFQRAMVNGKVIHSVQYSCVTRRNSFTVRVNHCDFKFGQIQYYLKMFATCPNALQCSHMCLCKKAKFIAVVRPCVELKDVLLSLDCVTGAKVPHLVPVSLQDLSKVQLVNIVEIVELCIFTQGEQCSFVTQRPNGYEKE